MYPKPGLVMKDGRFLAMQSSTAEDLPRLFQNEGSYIAVQYRRIYIFGRVCNGRANIEEDNEIQWTRAARRVSSCLRGLRRCGTSS